MYPSQKFFIWKILVKCFLQIFACSHTLLAYTLTNVSQTGKCPRFYDRKKYLPSFLQTCIKYCANIFDNVCEIYG